MRILCDWGHVQLITLSKKKSKKKPRGRGEASTDEQVKLQAIQQLISEASKLNAEQGSMLGSRYFEAKLLLNNAMLLRYKGTEQLQVQLPWASSMGREIVFMAHRYRPDS